MKSYRARLACAAGLVLMLATSLSGCTAGVMQTSRQLKGGEVVISGVADEPGFYIIPRISANVAYGLGDVADVNLNLGTTVLTYSTGVGARLYPGDWLTLGAQANYTLLGVLGNNSTDGILTLNGRLTTTTKRDGRPLYGGVNMVLAGLRGYFDVFDQFSDEMADQLIFLSFSAGLVGGIETDLSDETSMQIELSYMPFGSNGNEGGFGVFPLSDKGFTPFILQLSFAIHYRIGDEPAAKPTQLDDPDALPPRPAATPEVEPSPVPVPSPSGDGPEAVPVPAP